MEIDNSVWNSFVDWVKEHNIDVYTLDLDTVLVLWLGFMDERPEVKEAIGYE